LPTAGVARRADTWTQFRPARSRRLRAAGSELDTTVRFQDLGVAAPRIRSEPNTCRASRRFVVPANDRATLRGIILKLDFNSQLGSEISYLRGRDKFGRVIEVDALDLVADIAPIKDVGNVGKRHHDEATGITG
jgi:hypothetical protein